MEKYLIDLNPELANDILMRSEKAKQFQDQPTYWKKEFLLDVIERCQPYLKEFEYGIAIEKNDDIPDYYPWLPNQYHWFLSALKVYEGEIKDVLLGWHHKHGDIFSYFEHEDDDVMISYYSQGHPQKEFRHKWDFTKENTSKYKAELELLEVTNPDRIISVGESVKKIMRPE